MFVSNVLLNMQFTFGLMADPKVEDTYNQEFSKGVVEDKGTILSLDEKITIPYGTFSNVLKTKDFSTLEPDIDENKYWHRISEKLKQ